MVIKTNVLATSKDRYKGFIDRGGDIYANITDETHLFGWNDR